MKRSWKEIMACKSVEDLRKRKQELYKKILQKHRLTFKYEHLIVQIRGNCSDYIQEYEMIDRAVFIKEGKVNVLNSTDTKRKEEKKIEKKIEDLTASEASLLLSQLLAIKKGRQSVESE